MSYNLTMIVIEVLECPDQDYLGQFSFYKSFIRIGSGQSVEFCLNDKQIKKNHLVLDIQDNQLNAAASEESDLFWVNGKRTAGIKSLKVGDTIQIGETKFKIVNFLNMPIESKRERLNRNTEELIKSNSPLLSYIKNLQEKA